MKQTMWISKEAYLAFCAIGIIGLILFALVGVDTLPFLGTVHAATGDQQKDEEGLASGGNALADGKAPSGKDSRRDLVVGQPLTPEFLRIIEKRLKELQAREETLARREKELVLLRKDIEERLQRLQEARRKLEAMTRQVEKSRREGLGKTVPRYAAMDPKNAAEILDQTDLGLVSAILKKMDEDTAGAILDEMVKLNSRTGRDPSPEKAEKLRKLTEAMAVATGPVP